MWKNLFILISLIATLTSLKAQSIDAIELANEYYYQGDYEKAEKEYRKLAKDAQAIPVIHKNYLALLTQQKSYKKAENYLAKVIKTYPANSSYRIDLGQLYDNMDNKQKAEDVYLNLINEVTNNAVQKNGINQVRILAQNFYEKNLNQYSLMTYQESRKKLQRADQFALELANLYRVLNQKENMVVEYLTFAKSQPQNLNYVKNIFQRFLPEPEDLDTLEITLYDFIQQETGNPIYNELLIWTHLQQKNFSAALRQARALDKRSKSDGRNIINVGIIAFRNEDFKTAEKAFAHIINEFPEGPNLSMAKRYSLLSREEVIKSTFPVDKEKVKKLISDYRVYQSEARDVFVSLEAQRKIGLLQAFQLNEIDSALLTLKTIVEQPIGKNQILAESKMDLADIYLLNGEPWESILLYGQVEREYKDEPLGYKAKLKSAKLSYFKGEFELAQGHLDILKLATSREIANDALDLSILIKNNTVFDTTDLAMQAYANIELLLFQNMKTEALQAIDTMLVQYENHSLEDELLLTKAKTLRELGNFEQALASLEIINTKYYYDILGDDAYFLTGQILELDLKKTEEAMKIYESMLTKFPGSIYVSEARNRFRNLRGDFNN